MTVKKKIAEKSKKFYFKFQTAAHGVLRLFLELKKLITVNKLVVPMLVLLISVMCLIIYTNINDPYTVCNINFSFYYYSYF